MEVETIDSNTSLTGLLLTPRDNQITLWALTPLFLFPSKLKFQKRGHLLVYPHTHFLEVSKAHQTPIFTTSGLFLVMSQGRHGWGGGQGRTGSPVIIPVHSTQHSHHLQLCTDFKAKALLFFFFLICLTFLFPSASDHYHAQPHMYKGGKQEPLLSVCFIKLQSQKVHSEQRFLCTLHLARSPGKKKCV